jgi:hypothetical protein
MSRRILTGEERKTREDMKTSFRRLKTRPMTFTVYFAYYDMNGERRHGEFDIIEDIARGKQAVGNGLRDIIERLNSFEMPIGAEFNWVYNGVSQVM